MWTSISFRMSNLYIKKKRALLRKPEQKFDWKDLGKSLLLTLAATGISFLFYELGLREANIIIVYLLGVLLTAVWTNGYSTGFWFHY